MSDTPTPVPESPPNIATLRHPKLLVQFPSLSPHLLANALTHTSLCCDGELLCQSKTSTIFAADIFNSRPSRHPPGFEPESVRRQDKARCSMFLTAPQLSHSTTQTALLCLETQIADVVMVIHQMQPAGERRSWSSRQVVGTARRTVWRPSACQPVVCLSTQRLSRVAGNAGETARENDAPGGSSMAVLLPQVQQQIVEAAFSDADPILLQVPIISRLSPNPMGVVFPQTSLVLLSFSVRNSSHTKFSNFPCLS